MHPREKTWLRSLYARNLEPTLESLQEAFCEGQRTPALTVSEMDVWYFGIN